NEFIHHRAALIEGVDGCFQSRLNEVAVVFPRYIALPGIKNTFLFFLFTHLLSLTTKSLTFLAVAFYKRGPGGIMRGAALLGGHVSPELNAGCRSSVFGLPCSKRHTSICPSSE